MIVVIVITGLVAIFSIFCLYCVICYFKHLNEESLELSKRSGISFHKITEEMKESEVQELLKKHGMAK